MAAARNIRIAVEEMLDMMDYFTENIRGEQLWMTADNLDDFRNVVHAFTTREGGVSEGIYSSLNLGFSRGDDPEKVEENYQLICSAVGIDPASIVATRQIHSDIVRKVGAADKREHLSDPVPYEADALITDESNVTLAVFTADCIPVLLYAEDSNAIGAAHAGWRGTVADIVGKTVKAMCEEYNGKPENIYAAIGAGIGVCCFETGAEVYEAVKALGLDCDISTIAVDDKNGKYHVDLKEINRLLLVRAGVPDENIVISSECTKCSCEKYWSHRATNGERGTQAALISLR